MDHVIPRWAGGGNEPGNLWAAHALCNMRDGGKTGARITNGRREPSGRIETRPLQW